MKKLLVISMTALSTGIAGYGTTAMATQIASINPGETIIINATLHTSDLDENGEGEPLIITAGGNIIGTTPNYGVPTSFSYTAPSNANGPTQLSYDIQNYDGDEWVTTSSIINPPPTPKTQDQISTWNRYAANLGMISGATGAFGSVGCRYTGPFAGRCGVAAGVITGLTSMLGGYYGRLATDPIDPNFTSIATPASVQLPANLTVGTAIATDESKAIALAAALITTFNRYQGAVAANDAYWAAKQLDAINDYNVQLKHISGNIPADLKTFIEQLTTLGVPATIDINATDVFNFEDAVSVNGLDPGAIDIFNQLGLSADDMSMAKEIVTVQDIDALAGRYPDFLNSLASQLPSDAGAVPEPGTVALFMIALLAMWYSTKKRTGKTKIQKWGITA